MTFNEQVYALVRRIPPGKVLSYGRVAWLLGIPKGARAVGWALHSLAHSTDVPWQRVINAKGYISTSCVEHTAAIQRERLEAEGIVFDQYDHVDMARFMWSASDWEARAIIEEAMQSSTGT